MSDTDNSWVLVVRDVSRSVRVRGQHELTASLVLDMGSGQVLGHSIAASRADALHQACRAAFFEPAGTPSSPRPESIRCPVGVAVPLARELRRLKISPHTPAVIESAPIDDAEDVLDSLIGHLGGRRQPDDFATPADFRLLVRESFAFCVSKPWSVFTDEDDLSIKIGIGDALTTATAVVLGNAGLQYGMVLYPGSAVPAGLRSSDAVDQGAAPPGTVMFMLDPPDEPPADLVAKAMRYGWPPGTELVPTFLGVDRSGACDLGRQDVQRLTSAIAAVARLAKEAPSPHEATAKPLKGRVALADAVAKFTIRRAATHEYE